MKTTKTSKSNPKLYAILQKLKTKYSGRDYLHSDPISIVHRYKDPLDIELVALIVSLYSYGNVTAIMGFLDRMLVTMKDEPYQFLSRTFQASHWEGKLGVYRFQKEKDTIEFLRVLSGMVQSHRSQNSHSKKNEPIFERIFITGDPSFNQGILNFQKSIRSQLKFESYGLQFLLGKGIQNSSYKRYNMFLRWMTGKDLPDLGLYRKFPESSILLPLDTHITRIGRILSLTKSKTPGLKMAMEITENLTKICGEPAIRYDFALSRIGILQRCRAAYVADICRDCDLKEVCRFYPTTPKKSLIQ